MLSGPYGTEVVNLSFMTIHHHVLLPFSVHASYIHLSALLKAVQNAESISVYLSIPFVECTGEENSHVVQVVETVTNLAFGRLPCLYLSHTL